MSETYNVCEDGVLRPVDGGDRGFWVRIKDHDAALAAKNAQIAELEELVDRCIITLDAYDIEATALDDARLYVTAQQQAEPVMQVSPEVSKQISKRGRDAIMAAERLVTLDESKTVSLEDMESRFGVEPATRSEDGREVVGYTTPGMLEIARELNGEGRIGVRGKRDERFSVPVYTSAQGDDWGAFIGYLIDKCEGHEVTEENLQGWMCEMLADPHYGALFRREKQPNASVLEVAQPARQPVEDGREVLLTESARDVLAERRRQVTAEGWTPEHDDAHGHGAMALAAGCYARHAHQPSNWHGRVPESWPWGSFWWKPKTARENLVRAGALILAEIERLDRAAATKGDSHE